MRQALLFAAVFAALAAWALRLPLVARLLRLPQVLVSAAAKDDGALRIGILGASFIARVAVVHAADKRRDVRVVAVAARDSSRAADYATRHGIASFHGGRDAYEELLRREDVDAVYIGLPTQLHRRWTLAALAAGKHVLVEKPVAANLQEASELESAARRAGLIVFEAAHYRYHPALRRVRSLLLETGSNSSSQLGRLRSLEATFTMLDPKAWLGSRLGFPAEPGRDSESRQHERLKNLDRWWYCADSLLWASGSREARVLSVTEGRFSVSAQLELQILGSDGSSQALSPSCKSRFQGHRCRGFTRTS
ncbi:unnamed protein product [Polarella glacialis]|uniref:D-xylose 1-dehydrogenase (NADP(+), D-xylono-1,5-lactone-forming) n=1 Tax=Polarella glacialis TaxID=89957 RepID=A0A813K399_POLGL|nr:unnamed protein product [Polarella glacialis]CAE8692972.1 unnamed protein product [Polarella glacialis]